MLEAADAILAQRRWATFAVLAMVLLPLWASRITGATVEDDAAQTLRMAVTLVHEGTASDDSQPPFRPGMKREPVPVLLTAAVVAVMDVVKNPAPLDAYFSGDRARVLKYQNVLWMALLCGVVYAAVFVFTSSPLASVAGALLVNLPLLSPTNEHYLLDSLCTEAPAAALLVISSLLLVFGVWQQRGAFIATAGVAFGLLTLTKAVFLFVFVGLLLALIIARLVAWTARCEGMRSAHLIVFAACFAAIVSPWMYRNHVALGALSITERGGEVLYVRALKDRMTTEEVRGAIFYWAPWPVNGVLRRIFGFSRMDLERGGRLQHLNRWERSTFAPDDLRAQELGRPQDAIAYYRQSRAELNRLILESERAGHPDPELAANQVQQRRAINMILERPFEHLAMTALFLWRGAFLTFPILALALSWAAWRREYRFALFVMPAMGMVLFYGLFSHFIGRYGLPAYPIAIIAGVTLCVRWTRCQASD